MTVIKRPFHTYGNLCIIPEQQLQEKDYAAISAKLNSLMQAILYTIRNMQSKGYALVGSVSIVNGDPRIVSKFCIRVTAKFLYKVSQQA